MFYGRRRCRRRRFNGCSAEDKTPYTRPRWMAGTAARGLTSRAAAAADPLRPAISAAAGARCVGFFPLPSKRSRGRRHLHPLCVCTVYATGRRGPASFLALVPDTRPWTEEPLKNQTKIQTRRSVRATRLKPSGVISVSSRLEQIFRNEPTLSNISELPTFTHSLFNVQKKNQLQKPILFKK